MVDYALFEPRIWVDVCRSVTPSEFLFTAQFQIARRVRRDPNLGDDFPSFEMDWRRSLATRLKHALPTPPVALCPSIHRVIPVGVSSADAMLAMKVAVPKDIQDPYTITVQAPAVDDKCGSIAITQPMNYTVVNVICTINPGILVEVCRELRMGHKSVVEEVHKMSQQLSMMKTEMALMATRLPKPDKDDEKLAQPEMECSKRGCTRIVTKRFRSGKPHRQCSGCISYVREAGIIAKKDKEDWEKIDNMSVQ